MIANNSFSWLDRAYQLAPNVQIGSVHTQIYRWGYAQGHPDNQPHRHSFYEACYVAKRRGRYFYADQCHLIEQGDVFLACPGIVHQIVSDGEMMELYWVSFDWERNQLPQDDAGVLFSKAATSKRVVARDDGRLEQAWLALRAACSEPNIGAKLQADYLSASILIAICQLLCPETDAATDRMLVASETTLIRQAVLYIRDNLARPLTVLEVSNYVNVSGRHFSRLFSKQMGCTFVKFVNQVRVETAVELLRNTDLSIKQIAEQTGYDDVHYFTRVFTRAAGVPPAKYRHDPTEHGAKIQRPGSYV